MQLVLFDCDGTLVDSAGLIHEVMTRTCAHFGHARPELSRTKGVIGLTLDLAIARVLEREHVDDEAIAMATHYKTIFSGVRAEAVHSELLFAGIRPLIDDLGGREHILIGAVTGKSRRGLDTVLDVHDFRRHFIVSRTADDCPSKPHPAMVNECCHETGMQAKDTLVVGDAVYDMQMAKAAGAQAIGVSWGYASVDALRAAGADAILDHPEDLLRYIE